MGFLGKNVSNFQYKRTFVEKSSKIACRKAQTEGRMLRQDAEGHGREGNSSGKMPMAFRKRENATARCQLLFGRRKLLRHDADGFSEEGNSSGTMPMAFRTKETAPARCRWLFGRRKLLRHDADGFSEEGKCNGNGIFEVFYEIVQN